MTEFPHASLCYLTEPTPGQPVINVQTPDGQLVRAIVNHEQLKILETFEFKHGGVSFVASYGRDDGGKIKELFLSGGKAGSVIEAMMSDASTSISIALQSGVKPHELAHSMVRNPDGQPASPLGVVLDDMVMG